MIFENLTALILASASPRRAALLQSIGLVFQVVPSGVEEDDSRSVPPEVMAELWARDKAVAVASRFTDTWVLAADTVVLANGALFGKPKSPQEAISTLRILSGRSHRVVTGMALVNRARGILELRSAGTEVLFKQLSEAEIAAYAQTGKPMDKAGAYGIQGLGAFLVVSIRGSYTNVVGLPLAETVDWLLHHGVIRPRGSDATALFGGAP
jgi:septum formation protein